MKFFKLIGVLLGAPVLIGALAGSALAGAAKAGRSAVRTVVHFPANGPGGQASNTCFWGTSYTQETRNIIWPDSHTDYPVSIDTIPAGGKIVVHGQFPHARFFSLTTSSTLGVIRGHLYDDHDQARSGSTNPFLPGANRSASPPLIHGHRRRPARSGPWPRAAEHAVRRRRRPGPGAGPMLIVERVYLPDRGRDFTGGVGVPAVTLRRRERHDLDRSGRMHRPSDQARCIQSD